MTAFSGSFVALSDITSEASLVGTDSTGQYIVIVAGTSGGSLTSTDYGATFKYTSGATAGSYSAWNDPSVLSQCQYYTQSLQVASTISITSAANEIWVYPYASSDGYTGFVATSCGVTSQSEYQTGTTYAYVWSYSFDVGLTWNYAALSRTYGSSTSCSWSTSAASFDGSKGIIIASDYYRCNTVAVWTGDASSGEWKYASQAELGFRKIACDANCFNALLVTSEGGVMMAKNINYYSNPADAFNTNSLTWIPSRASSSGTPTAIAVDRTFTYMAVKWGWDYVTGMPRLDFSSNGGKKWTTTTSYTMPNYKIMSINSVGDFAAYGLGTSVIDGQTQKYLWTAPSLGELATDQASFSGSGCESSGTSLALTDSFGVLLGGSFSCNTGSYRYWRTT
jgi:hypothetical protein